MNAKIGSEVKDNNSNCHRGKPILVELIIVSEKNQEHGSCQRETKGNHRLRDTRVVMLSVPQFLLAASVEVMTLTRRRIMDYNISEH